MEALGMWGPVVTAGNAQSGDQTSVENGLCFKNKMAVVNLVRGSLEFRWSPYPNPHRLPLSHSSKKVFIVFIYVMCVH